MVVQDDAREKELISLFDLTDGQERSGNDATLEMDGLSIPFELKSTTRDSVTTVRDFGPDHIAKWKGKHWLIGFYDTRQALEYCLYGSPADMEPWILEKEKYIRADFQLAEYAPALLTTNELYEIMGKKKVYSLEDAKSLHKRQLLMSEYRTLMDLSEGYSVKRMLDILKQRCRYVIERGATLNNPHIPKAYFSDWDHIAPGDRKSLLSKVRAFLQSE